MGKIGAIVCRHALAIVSGMSAVAVALADGSTNPTPLTLSVIGEPAPPPRASAKPATKLAKHEPEKGCYLGAYIDLDPALKLTYVDVNGRTRRLPEAFEALVKRPHAMYFFYLGYGQPLPADWVRILAAEGKFVHIALEPNSGLSHVRDDAYLRTLAADMRDSGAKIFLRFASEMNGPWVAYHGDPGLYREKFRLVSKVMREVAPNVAMVWCVYTTPRAPIPSYYPGDAWVDWVGVNIYNVTYFDQDRKTPAHHVTPTEMLDYIYTRYAERKPIMICEYAATHFSAVENKNVAHFAERNIAAMYGALAKRYPRVKAINYFNTNALALAHRQNNNYTVTGDERVLLAYRKAIAGPHFLGPPKPVVATAAPAALPTISNLVDDMSLQRKTKVGVVVRDLPEVSVVRFLVDESVVTAQRTGSVWFTEVDPARLAPGRRTIRAEGLDVDGRIVALGEVAVQVELPASMLRKVG